MFERKISKEELKAEIEAVVNPQLFALRKELDSIKKQMENMQKEYERHYIVMNTVHDNLNKIKNIVILKKTTKKKTAKKK